MNFEKYRKSIETTPGPISITDLEYTIDIPTLVRYAREKGVLLHELSQEEMGAFVVKREAADEI